MTMKKRMFLWLAGMFCGTVLAALPSEITVTVKPSQDVYVEGERMRVVVDIANASPDVIDCRNECENSLVSFLVVVCNLDYFN